MDIYGWKWQMPHGVTERNNIELPYPSMSGTILSCHTRPQVSMIAAICGIGGSGSCNDPVRGWGSGGCTMAAPELFQIDAVVGAAAIVAIERGKAEAIEATAARQIDRELVLEAVKQEVHFNWLILRSYLKL